jgi:MYXO-CTERM domain-containing protein
MSGRPLRLRGRPLLALPCLVVALLAGLPARPAAAAEISHCTTTRGVVVVVDFRHFGGAIDRGCGPTPTTGYDAMHHAGFNTAGDDQDGPAFVCRIDDFPTPAQQSCARTPPTSAAWSYWHANPGQNSWSFSELGAMSSHPQAGSVDAWVYGSTVGGGQNGEPAFSPASVRAKGPPPTPTPTPTPVHPAKPPPSQHHSDAPSTPTPTPAATRSAHRRHKHPAKTVAVPSPSTTPSGPRVVVGLSPDGLPRKSSGSPTGLIVGISLVVVLAGAGGLTAWRRRRQSP